MATETAAGNTEALKAEARKNNPELAAEAEALEADARAKEA